MPVTRSTRNNGSSGLSEYELKRRTKMAENATFLRKLGMARVQKDISRQLQSSKCKVKNSKSKKVVTTPKTLRRSSRLRDAPVHIAVAKKRRLQEKRKQQIGINAAKRKRYLVARRKREAAVAAAAAATERSFRAENRASY